MKMKKILSLIELARNTRHDFELALQLYEADRSEIDTYLKQNVPSVYYSIHRRKNVGLVRWARERGSFLCYNDSADTKDGGAVTCFSDGDVEIMNHIIGVAHYKIIMIYGYNGCNKIDLSSLKLNECFLRLRNCSFVGGSICQSSIIRLEIGALLEYTEEDIRAFFPNAKNIEITHAR